MQDNVAQAQGRKRKLESKGAFRTLLQPTAFKRRAGVPNWSSEVHTAATVTPGHVTDSEGHKYDTRMVLPVSLASSAVVQQRSVAPRDAQRKAATDTFLPALIQAVRSAGDTGMTLSNAGKMMARRQGFSNALKQQRMTFKQFVQVNAAHFRVQIQANASKIFMSASDEVARKSGFAAHAKERPDGTLMQFQRLRPIREAG